MYQIIAADSRSPRDGKFLEIIGRYEPLKSPALIEANEQRVLYWLKNGAQPSDTVRSLLQRSGIWLLWSQTKRGVDEAGIAAEMEKWRGVQAEKAQRDVDRKTRRTAARRKARDAGATPEATPAPVAAPSEA